MVGVGNHVMSKTFDELMRETVEAAAPTVKKHEIPDVFSLFLAWHHHARIDGSSRMRFLTWEPQCKKALRDVRAANAEKPKWRMEQWDKKSGPIYFMADANNPAVIGANLKKRKPLQKQQ